jgi:hypothetical protein
MEEGIIMSNAFMEVVMKKIKLLKKIMCVACSTTLALSMLSGCGTKNENAENADQVAMSVGGHDITQGELMVYSLLELLSGEEAYSDVQSDEATYKDKVITSAREDAILYDVAEREGIEFTDSDVETRDGLIESFKKYVPDDIFEEYGITDDTINQVFERYTYVEKLDNDKKNELGQSLTEEYTEAFKNANFQSLYYIVFPTIEADENDEPVEDADGNYIELSDEEKADVKEQAEKAAKAINDGEDIATVVSEYGVEAYSSETVGYVGAYSDDLNEVLGSLTAGQCTEVYESSTGYYFIAVETDHDADLLNSYAYSLAENKVDDKYDEQRQAWIDEVATPSDAEFVTSFWDDFSLLDMATYLNKKGILE